MRIEQDSVRCHSGHTYAQRPVSFTYHGQKYQVKQIITEWRQPSKKQFVVLSESGKKFKLIFDLENQQWQIQPTSLEPTSALRRQGQ